MTNGGPGASTNTWALEIVKRTLTLNYGRAAALSLALAVVLFFFAVFYRLFIMKREFTLL